MGLHLATQCFAGLACPSRTQYHEEIDDPAARLPTDQDCTEALQSTPQLLFANLMTASAICNTLWLYLCQRVHYSDVAFDLVKAQMCPTAGITLPVSDFDE